MRYLNESLRSIKKGCWLHYLSCSLNGALAQFGSRLDGAAVRSIAAKPGQDAFEQTSLELLASLARFWEVRGYAFSAAEYALYQSSPNVIGV